jgi:hypothetical protein
VSLRSKPLQRNTRPEILLRLLQGSSPRKPGSLLMEVARCIAALQTASAQYPTRDIAALDAGSSPRESGSLPIEEAPDQKFRARVLQLADSFSYNRFRFDFHQHFRRNQL